MKRVVMTVLALLVGACGQAVDPTPAPVAWQIDVPAPAATYVVIPRDAASGKITLLPASPTGAMVDVDYAYRMPPCGIRGLIDVDGSFWDAVGDRDSSYDYDLAPGTFRLTTPSTATFSAPGTEVLHLQRHQGHKEFEPCF